MYEQFDVTLEDADLMGEVELTTDLICAVSEFDRNLTNHEIDKILDVVPIAESVEDAQSRATQARGRYSPLLG